MQIDDTAKWHLFDYAHANGFQGSRDQWDHKVRQQVDATAVRQFCDANVRVGLWGHDKLQRMLSSLCEKALTRFERVHTSLGGLAHGHISFSGRANGSRSGVRLQQLDIDICTQGNRTTVRCRGYVDGEIRLDRGFAVEMDWEAKA